MPSTHFHLLDHMENRLRERGETKDTVAAPVSALTVLRKRGNFHFPKFPGRLRGGVLLSSPPSRRMMRGEIPHNPTFGRHARPQSRRIQPSSEPNQADVFHHGRISILLLQQRPRANACPCAARGRRGVVRSRRRRGFAGFPRHEIAGTPPRGRIDSRASVRNRGEME